MNENKFLKANAIQTVNFVKEFLSFNMSESLGDFLEGDHKKKVEMTSELNNILGDITLVEGELEKIEKVILADPSYAEVKEITDAKTLLENELNNLRSIWQEKNNELKNFEIVEEDKSEPEEEEEEELEAKEDEEEKVEPKEEPTEEPELEPEAEVVIEEPTEPQVQPEVVAHGLAGAEGTQNTAIQGNDHIEAHADQAVDTNGGVVNAGFAGAEVPHVDNAPEPQISVNPVPVLTPGTATEVIQGAAAPVAVPVSAGQEAAVDVAVVDVAAPAAEETTSEPIEGGQDETPEEEIVKGDEEGKSEEDEEVTESIGADSKVKDKVTGQPGTVTSVGDEHFIVLLDDGSSVERKLSELEDIEEEIEQNITNNEKPINAEEVTEGAQSEEIEGEENSEKEEDEKEQDGFVFAALTIDLGPFKAGEQVEIDAANYTAVGDDDPVKLKDEKEGVGEIPKKYLNVVEIEKGVGSGDGVDAKIEDVLMKIKELETFLVGKNIKGSKAIEGAKEKIKKFAASLEDAEEEKQKGDESDANKGEEAK